jgi:hypothetical protein
MRQVHFTSKERVDVPDMQVVSSGVQAEFRRQLRAWVGGDFVGILRGFKVEPEAPVSTRVLVKMDNGGPSSLFYSQAIGAHDLGGIVDYGELIGGADTAGNLEGPAQLLLDFSGEAIGDHIVEMRYATTLGDTDNRAFWDEGADDEFVQSVPTRILPSWEIQIVPAATGGAWIPLARVAWDGATVDAVDITDVRFLFLEGSDAETGFDFATQSVALPDFNRARERGDYGVGHVSPLAMIQALQRQVMDLKGQDEDGFFNHYNRPFRPPGGTEASWADQTKSLRTVDTVTFTVGDGSSDYGDFNGQSGLNECLTHISTEASNLPRRIKIILKNRAAPGSTPFHGITTPVVIDGKDIEILAEVGHGFAPPPPVAPGPESFSPVTSQHTIAFNLALGVTALTMTSTSARTSLRLKNIKLNRPGNDISLIDVEGPVDAKNTAFYGRIGVLGEFALQCHSEGTLLQDCYGEGVFNIGGHGSATGLLAANRGGEIIRTVFTRSVLRLRSLVDTPNVGVTTAIPFVCQKMTLDQCRFLGRADDAGGDWDFGPDGAHGQGMIDARGATGVSWKDCHVEHSSEEDGIRFGSLPTNVAGLDVIGGNCSIEGTEFRVYHDRTNALGAGVGGARGTGHHINLLHETTPISSFFQCSEFRFENNKFTMGASLLVGSNVVTPDSAAIRMTDVSKCWITGNKFTDLVQPATGSVGGIHIDAVFQNSFIWIEKNFIGDHSDNMQTLTALFASGVTGLHVCGNRITPYARDNFGGTAFDITNFGVLLENIGNWFFDKNEMVGWTNDADPLDNRALVLRGFANVGHCSHNIFRNCGGSNIISEVGSILLGTRWDSNYFEMSGDETRWTSAIDLSNSLIADGNYWVGNNWGYLGVPFKDAIRLGNGLNFTLTNNWFNRGFARHGTLGGVATTNGIGYGAIPSSVSNLFTAGYV